MGRFRKVPEEIEAIRFEGNISTLPDGVVIRWLGESQGWRVWNDLHASWIKVKEGDMIRIDKAPVDVYPIDAETFLKTYVGI